MIRNSAGSLVYYTFPSLEDLGLGHAVVTRHGGTSQPPFAGLNVGHSVGDDPEKVDTNHRLIFNHWGLDRERVVTARQVHGHMVAVVGRQDGGKVIPDSDALATAERGLALLLRFADCVPILLYDPGHRAFALGHAGWRGIAAGLAPRMVRTMAAALGSDPKQLVAALGPAIGPCCYQVGEEVIAAIQPAVPEWEMAVEKRNGTFYLDMWAAIARQLRAEGVRQVEVGGICTADNTEHFFSYRREKGRTGRFATLAWLKE